MKLRFLLFSVLASCRLVAAPSEQAIRTAIEKSIPLLEAGTKGSIEKRARCFTCHNQAFPVIALATARDRGFKIDEANLERQVKFTADFLKKNKSRYLEGRGQGGQVDTTTWALRAMEHGDWKADATTDAVMEYLLKYQRTQDFWKAPSNRPPTEKSPFAATRGGIRALQHYAKPELSKRIKKRFATVRDWLFENLPADTEDRMSRLRAMNLLGETKEAAREVKVLLSEQRKDGGWAQLPKMKSDAYATGTVLAALHQAGGIAVANEAYQRGIEFLLENQREDGSWLVVSRSKPFQSYYESGYPHATNQFISISAASWATTALALTLPETNE
ncbi:MAG: prenyltransferase/squalene oxidase repeat-containing protein [Limisphaerales bacterium]